MEQLLPVMFSIGVGMLVFVLWMEVVDALGWWDRRVDR